MIRLIIAATCLVALLAAPANALAQPSTQDVTIEVFLQSYDTFDQLDDGTCSGQSPYTQLTFAEQSFDLRNGERKLGKKSPTKKTGCLIELSARVSGTGSIAVGIGDKKVGTLTSAELEKLDYRIQILVTPDGITAGPAWRFKSVAAPTPEPSPTKTVAPDLGAIEGTDSYMLGGSFKLYGSSGDEFSVYGGECFGRGGYSDIGVGAQVVVQDETGSIVAVGELEPDPSASSRECAFVFYVEVPDAKFYTVEISHRGGLSYSKTELEEEGWFIQVVLGY